MGLGDDAGRGEQRLSQTAYHVQEAPTDTGESTEIQTETRADTTADPAALRGGEV